MLQQPLLYVLGCLEFRSWLHEDKQSLVQNGNIIVITRAQTRTNARARVRARGAQTICAVRFLPLSLLLVVLEGFAVALAEPSRRLKVDLRVGGGLRLWSVPDRRRVGTIWALQHGLEHGRHACNIWLWRWESVCPQFVLKMWCFLLLCADWFLRFSLCGGSWQRLWTACWSSNRRRRTWFWPREACRSPDGWWKGCFWPWRWIWVKWLWSVWCKDVNMLLASSMALCRARVSINSHVVRAQKSAGESREKVVFWVYFFEHLIMKTRHHWFWPT